MKKKSVSIIGLIKRRVRELWEDNELDKREKKAARLALKANLANSIRSTR